MSALDFGLRFEGMPEETIAEIHKQLPAMERLVEAVEQAEPHITAINPIYIKAWPDAVAVTPLLKTIIAFIKQKENGS
jgi:hypothetical protein